MRPIFETCVPRADVLSGELRDDMFAARLGDVVGGRADPIYQDPARFFTNTYPTSGLKTLIGQALGRLAGLPSGAPVIRLETTFGGGKTHNLIALYHLVNGPVDASTVERFVNRVALDAVSGARVVALVGDALDPNGLDHGDVKTKTLWGEIAYQLGGAEGYRLVEESDEHHGPAPGCQFIEQLTDGRPLLIMIDEIARHLRVASAVEVGSSTLAGQTIAFLMSLLGLAASRERTVVVFTLATEQDAFAKETDQVREALHEARSVAGRVEVVSTPAQETERPSIVAHRLFERVDRAAAEEVASEYVAYYRDAEGRGADLPDRALRGEYAKDIELHYPFHPELLLTLNRKTATIPNFQSTRGALRLLAATVRNLWRKQPADTYLIHPHHLDLSDETVLNDLTSRLDRQSFRQIVEADIATPTPGSVANATEVDRQFTDSGRPPYATRAATTIFLHSLVQGVASGVDPADLQLATLQPGDDPALLKRAIDQLVDKCWHLEWDGRRYQFKPEPQLNKIVEDEKASVGRTRAKGELDERIGGIWKRSFLQPVYFPTEAGEVDDDAREPKLVIVHYDAASMRSPDEDPPELVRKIAEYAGTQNDFRSYPNNLVFLVADAALIDSMVEQARRYLAIDRIVGDQARLADFNDEQRKRLRAMRDAADLEVRVAITRAYRYLLFPAADAPAKRAYLRCETLPAQQQGEVKQDQTHVVLRVLKAQDKVLTGDDSPLPPAYLKSRAWRAGADRMTTEELRKAFARQRNMKMLLDPSPLKTTIKKGVESGLWVYYDAREGVGYAEDSPPPLVQIGDDFELLTPEEAQRANVAIKGREAARQVCPLCGQAPCACVQGLVRDAEAPAPAPPVPSDLRASGAPAQALQAIRDQAFDRGVRRIRRLELSCEGMNKEGVADVVAMGLAIPQLGKADFSVRLELTAEFGDNEMLRVQFDGRWDRYRTLKQATDALGREASKASVRITVAAHFADGLSLDDPVFESMRDVLANLGLGRLEASAAPAEEDRS